MNLVDESGLSLTEKAVEEKKAKNREEKVSEIKKYNEAILDHTLEVPDNIVLFGRDVIVRPFKLDNETQSGLTLALKTNYVDPENHRVKTEEMKYPYQFRAVVVGIGSEVEKDIKLGDIVHLDLFPWERFIFYWDKNKFFLGENYFSVKVKDSFIQGKEV